MIYHEVHESHIYRQQIIPKMEAIAAVMFNIQREIECFLCVILKILQ